MPADPTPITLATPVSRPGGPCASDSPPSRTPRTGPIGLTRPERAQNRALRSLPDAPCQASVKTLIACPRCSGNSPPRSPRAHWSYRSPSSVLPASALGPVTVTSPPDPRVLAVVAPHHPRPERRRSRRRAVRQSTSRTRPARRGGTTSASCARALPTAASGRSPAISSARRRSRRLPPASRSGPGRSTARRTRRASSRSAAATSCTTRRRPRRGTAATTACLGRRRRSRAGPFVDNSSGPWLCMDARGGVIDPSPFIDNVGRRVAGTSRRTTSSSTDRSPSQIFVIKLTRRRIESDRARRSSMLSTRTRCRARSRRSRTRRCSSSRASTCCCSRGAAGPRAPTARAYATCNGPVGPCHEVASGVPHVVRQACSAPAAGPIFTDQARPALDRVPRLERCARLHRRQRIVRAQAVRRVDQLRQRPHLPHRSAAALQGARADRGLPPRRDRRRHLRVRQPAVLREHGQHRAEPPDHRDGAHRQRWRLLAARLRRRHLQLRRTRTSTARRAVSASHNRSSTWSSTPSGHGYWLANANGSVYAYGDAKNLRLGRRAGTLPIVGHDRHADRSRLLARDQRRTDPSLRRRPLVRLDRRVEPADPRHDAHTIRVTAIGCSVPTAASSPSATRTSTARPAASTSTSPSSGCK